jgi:hypothetical protein
MGKAKINMKYEYKENRLRVILWGKLEFIEGMLSSISMLVEQTNL